MADKKISALTEATTITSTDVLPIINSNETKKVKTETISHYSQTGWARYQDDVYDSNNKLALSSETQVTLPNNAAITTKSADFVSFYDNSTTKLLGDNLNDVFIITVEFKASSSNTQNTHLDLSIQNGGGNVQNLDMVVPFYKGNNETQQEHKLIQYYIDQSFIDNGATLKIQSHGGSANIWDIEYFIQRTQRYF